MPHAYCPQTGANQGQTVCTSPAQASQVVQGSLLEPQTCRLALHPVVDSKTAQLKLVWDLWDVKTARDGLGSRHAFRYGWSTIFGMVSPLLPSPACESSLRLTTAAVTSQMPSRRPYPKAILGRVWPAVACSLVVTPHPPPPRQKAGAGRLRDHTRDVKQINGGNH